MQNAGHERSEWSSPTGRAVLAVMLLLGGAACARPQAATKAEIDAAAARRDTVALARLAERECTPRSGAAKQTCYEDYFVRLAGSDRVHVALGALSRGIRERTSPRFSAAAPDSSSPDAIMA